MYIYIYIYLHISKQVTPSQEIHQKPIRLKEVYYHCKN